MWWQFRRYSWLLIRLHIGLLCGKSLPHREEHTQMLFINRENDLNGKQGRTPLTGGRTSDHLARTPARAFESQRIRQRPRARTSASFGCDPRRWRDPIAHQFNKTPDMIGQATGHRRSAGHPGALPRLLVGSGATQLMMGPTEIVGAAQQIHPAVQSGQSMSGMTAFAR